MGSCIPNVNSFRVIGGAQVWERQGENGATSAVGSNDTSCSTKLPATVNPTNGSYELITRRHSSEVLFNLGNENNGSNRTADPSR